MYRRGDIMRNNISMLKEHYKPGTKVQLIYMDDTQAPPSGTKGIVSFIDDIGTIHVKWETGSSLGLVYGVDSFKVI